MKLQELIQQIYYEPSLITPGAHASIRRIVESHLEGRAEWLFEAREPGKDRCGEKVAVAQAFVDENGIGHIPIGGAIGKNLSPFDRGSGVVDTNDVRRELAEFGADKRVRGIVLDMDSPGGMVMGTPETAAAIGESRKSVYAFSDGIIGSAAFWLAAACDGIFTTMTASVGAVGVYVPWVDQTKAFEEQGLKVDVIRSGKFKGMGFPGTALSEEQRALVQARVDEMGAMFRAAVQGWRPRIQSEDLEGQVFMGKTAMAKGFIDAVVRDKAEMVRMLF